MFGGAKYKNKKTSVGSKKFDSRLEAKHFLELVARQKAGEIHSLALQTKIQLTDKPKGRQRSYIADFVFFDNALASWVVMDSKGMKVEPYQTKRDWLLDKFCGFVFIERTRTEQKTYTPYGEKPILFGYNAPKK